MVFARNQLRYRLTILTLRFNLEVNFLVLLDAISAAVFYTDEEKFMIKLPEFLKQGETARLFPVLADTSKEGRATSILLSCMAKVDEFAAAQIKTLGLKPGKRTKLECFTEVVFSETSHKNKRPDGLIIVNSGAQKKYYLIEAKIGNAELNGEQIESYVKICKEQKLDGVITISNQYSASSDIHPLESVRKIKIKIPVFHWSWMSLLTTIDLMVTNEEIEDYEQMLLMNELRRFLSHESTGVKSFDKMPPEWSEINKIFSNKGSVSPKSDVATKVVEAWQQEAKDLCLVLSRLTNTVVVEKLSLAHRTDHAARTKSGIKTLIEKHCVVSSFEVPDAAAPIEVVADLDQRSVFVGMTIAAPLDKKSSKARLNWLLKQFKGCDTTDCFVRANWPGSSAPTSHAISDLLANPDLISQDKEHLAVSSFMVFGAYRFGGRFSQLANFISDLEDKVPEFYARLGQNLSQWKKPAPKINTVIEDVDVESIAREAEKF